ncbi:thioredoxin domain-containing protein [Clavibacter sp. VKM Ac-2873]|uniref:DsbA family protein n=1 Tax=Clavibacter sp. VKM Ac-2873 TaxID=2783813 RepID=UPI00188C3E00|nr:DsbA family protein [Clavibacter sp. VKM Ac-2873]MBF4619504.1 thioredoxin domain-containing protein [Clavibacter sp. VKM Ac-2873]
MPSLLRTLTAASTALAVAFSLVACSAAPATESTPTTSGPAGAVLPSGSEGAASFDGGYVRIGDGPKQVDLFIDPMCPYCKAFEEASGSLLFTEAAAGTTTVRVHPLAILNRLSSGSDYSSRAAATLVAVAATHPDSTQAFLQALYANQPAEQTPGLTDAELSELAASVGARPTASDEEMAAYRAWVDHETEAATTGPLEGLADLPAVHQVPTVVVDGAVFPGDSGDVAAFADFYARH